jgi:predicted RNase H-like HicB family nuclease
LDRNLDLIVGTVLGACPNNAKKSFLRTGNQQLTTCKSLKSGFLGHAPSAELNFTGFLFSSFGGAGVAIANGLAQKYTGFYGFAGNCSCVALLPSLQSTLGTGEGDGDRTPQPCSFSQRFSKLGCMKHEFTSVIEKRGKWYVAYVEEIPGVNTQGRTLAEARRNLKEALTLVLEANRALSAKDRSPDAKREPITVIV